MQLFFVDQVQQNPVIFISVIGHHSTTLPFFYINCEIVFIPLDDSGKTDRHFLHQRLIEHEKSPFKFGFFTATSNITGISDNVSDLCLLMHQFDGLAFFDFATSAPYENIDLGASNLRSFSHRGVSRADFSTYSFNETSDCPSDNSKGYIPMDRKKFRNFAFPDGVFFSMHKFVGAGMQSPGVLAFHRRITSYSPHQTSLASIWSSPSSPSSAVSSSSSLLSSSSSCSSCSSSSLHSSSFPVPHTQPPSAPGGGTVYFSSSSLFPSFESSLETREEPGTASAISIVRGAMALALKESVGVEWIRKRELEICNKVKETLGTEDGVVLFTGPFAKEKKEEASKEGMKDATIDGDGDGDEEDDDEGYHQNEHNASEADIPAWHIPIFSFLIRMPSSLSFTSQSSHQPLHSDFFPQRIDPANFSMFDSQTASHHTPQFLHPNFVCALLSDLFGIQVRSGCLCSGNLIHRLLHIDTKHSRFLQLCCEGAPLDEISASWDALWEEKKERRCPLKREEWGEWEGKRMDVQPGLTRVSLHYLMTDEEVDYVLSCIAWVAKYGAVMLCLYSMMNRSSWWRCIGLRMGNKDVCKALYLSCLPDNSQATHQMRQNDVLRFFKAVPLLAADHPLLCHRLLHRGLLWQIKKSEEEKDDVEGRGCGVSLRSDSKVTWLHSLFDADGWLFSKSDEDNETQSQSLDQISLSSSSSTPSNAPKSSFPHISFNIAMDSTLSDATQTGEELEMLPWMVQPALSNNSDENVKDNSESKIESQAITSDKKPHKLSQWQYLQEANDLAVTIVEHLLPYLSKECGERVQPQYPSQFDSIRWYALPSDGIALLEKIKVE
ncbi:putative cysteine desulfurase [Monocercomonoides exilis]|uniref:putative cysteine desulfurase n=1 Tax=Monocercomonoides exilis TaxID=2049356 RepID=UPI00355A9241|nr:putative cysteine desulfurase [Monocercomonoides exilis]|eukprot:MONOS_1328.1-p1 / transcript=MONOS_1328.1 / gene=MONOS_1328 / organism=Monocercomonoides_exilis_PA203 / gene_product=cysteine desulfurase putative / transcript_product=cysteine desulfurase putative / location=Mono_scaffold00023:10310-12876(+) / protein_length=834 / sequence_SO=supercontig / SO=protein_coding / is_pseudo=false